FTLTRERIAIAGSAASAILGDRDAYFTASITAILEATRAKAAASAMGRWSREMHRAPATLGRDVSRNALASTAPACPPSGECRVLFGPQPLSEILSYMVIPSLTTGSFYRAVSAYHGRFGRQVMDQRISLIDDPLGSGGAIRRQITCEGLPAQRTVLIRDG